MSLSLCTDLSAVPAAAWDALVPADQPMLRHAFLQTLADGGAVGPGTGWTPAHALWSERGRLRAAMPGWFKWHSRGEYVFDQGWADAAEQAGLAYYPKWLGAVPFTPITGPRVLGEPGAAAALVAALPDHPAWAGVSGWHVNFTDADSDACFAGDAAGWWPRQDVQFHWQRAQETDFEGFLARLTADRRKKIRQERRKVAALGLSLDWVRGDQLAPAEQNAIYACYAMTYAVRGQRPYLPPACFALIHQRLGEAVQVLRVRRDARIVAMAWYLCGTQTLYGRYWGALADLPGLHFEACYYQAIERALALGLSRVDAGAQGEHKLIRGFAPVFTRSWHRLRHPGLHRAVGEFLQQERAAVARYQAAASAACPYRR